MAVARHPRALTHPATNSYWQLYRNVGTYSTSFLAGASSRPLRRALSLGAKRRVALNRGRAGTVGSTLGAASRRAPAGPGSGIHSCQPVGGGPHMDQATPVFGTGVERR